MKIRQFVQPILLVALVIGFIFLDRWVTGFLRVLDQLIPYQTYLIVVRIYFAGTLLLPGCAFALPQWLRLLRSRGKLSINPAYALMVVALLAFAVYRGFYYQWSFFERTGLDLICLFLGYFLPWPFYRETLPTRASTIRIGKELLKATLITALVIGFLYLDQYVYPILKQQAITRLRYHAVIRYVPATLLLFGLFFALPQRLRCLRGSGKLKIDPAYFSVLLPLAGLTIYHCYFNWFFLLQRNGFSLIWLFLGYFLLRPFYREQPSAENMAQAEVAQAPETTPNITET